MRTILILGSLIGLAACDVPIEPVVSSFNGDSVEIQIPNVSFQSPESLATARAEADAKAADICRRGPNKKAEYVSTRTIATANAYVSNINHLYLCLR